MTLLVSPIITSLHQITLHCRLFAKYLCKKCFLTFRSWHIQVKLIRAVFIITVTVSKGFPTPTLCEQWMHAVTVSALRLSMSNKTPTKTLVSNVSGRERDLICLHACGTERERDARHAFTNFWFAVTSGIN